jgi:hypothetical protein
MVTFACKLMLNCTMQLEVREISVVSLFHWELQLFPRHIPSALRPAGAVVEVTKGKLGLYFFLALRRGCLSFVAICRRYFRVSCTRVHAE